MSNTDNHHDTDLLTRSRKEVREPPLYRVILLNDDFTPMDYVVDLLVDFFQKTMEEATSIMLQIHHNGLGVAGIFTHEVAETKVMQVNQHARDAGHPLKCTMERN